MIPIRWAHHVRDVDFRRSLLGYHRDDVRQHLDLVSGWFSVAGVDELLEERYTELVDQAEQRLSQAEKEAALILADARREADQVQRAAREEAQSMLEEARRHAALERRGRSRVGRPVGRRTDMR